MIKFGCDGILMKKICVLTGGGDCPGLNAVIRAVAKKSIKYNWEIIGIRDGWKGLINGDINLLTDYTVSGILPKGGTIIGTSRTNPFKKPEDVEKVQDNIKGNVLTNHCEPCIKETLRWRTIGPRSERRLSIGIASLPLLFQILDG